MDLPDIDDQQSQARGSRIRQLTEKGTELYKTQAQKYTSALFTLWDAVHAILEKYKTVPCELPALLAAEKDLLKAYEQYETKAEQYVDFLKANRCEESCYDLESFNKQSEQNNRKVKFALTDIKQKIISLKETNLSKRSLKFTASNVTRSSSAARQLRAKAEAAKAKLIFAEKQSILRKQKAELTAEIDLLEAKQEAAAAEAEAKIYEEDESRSQDLGDVKSEIDKMDRVRQYVKQQTIATLGPAQASDARQFDVDVRPPRVALPSLTRKPPRDTSPQARKQVRNIPCQCSVNQSEEFSKFLLRKDLLFSRLSSFNDRPECYFAWKFTFKCIIDELKLTPAEELDLMVKWLGPQSCKHAVSIKSSTCGKPLLGVQRLWERLDERYGAPEMIEAALKEKLEKFPKMTNKDSSRLFEFSDILSEIESVKEDPVFSQLLAYLDTSSGIKPLVSKLPYGLQDKWTTRAFKFRTNHNVPFTPFAEFVAFIREMSKMRNDPGFTYESATPQQRLLSDQPSKHSKGKVGTYRTKVEKPPEGNSLTHCILHNSKHSLDECRGFRKKTLSERRELLKQHNVCFKCCASNTHKSRDCNVPVCCKECNSKTHTTAMHIWRKFNQYVPQSQTSQDHGGEEYINQRPSSSDVDATPVQTLPVNSTCTEVCGGTYGGRSCAKIVPVTLTHKNDQHRSMKVYAIIDDQSNRSLASPKIFDNFEINDEPETYTLSTCAGKISSSGRRACGFIIESLKGDFRVQLPTLTECEHIPNNRDEIPSTEVALHHPHLREIASAIPPIDDNCEILILIGRDLLEAHEVLHQIIGPKQAPYGQQLKLGWVIIGESCLNSQHVSSKINVNRTHLLSGGRSSVFEPCSNKFEFKENLPDCNVSVLENSLFVKTEHDDLPGLSYDDQMFMQKMNEEFYRNSTGSWVAPLPFRTPRRFLPNNKLQALRRAKLLDASLKGNAIKREHFLTFMSNILDKRHAEVAPPLKENEECWFLPLFGVYHPKKPEKIRGVFDSSAKCDGISLNDVLLTGPNLMNNLLGVLMKFRKEAVAVTADIEHMFHCFIVKEEDRNYLRFLWHRDNDLDKELIDYRMRVHVFGNSPSPAVATLGLRKAAEAAREEFGSHVVEFVDQNFYVDDGLLSCASSREAITIVEDTKKALEKYGNLRLHKIVSNCEEVMSAFSSEDLATNLKDLDLTTDNKPLQRSLGMLWDINTDNLLFQFSDLKPVTRRGILSTLNSMYDPLGILAPVIIQGKLIQRQITTKATDWDEPLQDGITEEWNEWKESLSALKTLRISRSLVPCFSRAVAKELHVFCDASEKAIGAVAYLRTTDADSNISLGFVLGKSKVAPITGHTIPRLELCSAVLAVEIAQCVIRNLDITFDNVKYYTDSKIVLGYIKNTSRRFFTYVTNRVERIRKFSHCTQWNYVPTSQNPADPATRSLPAEKLQDSEWLLGPKRLLTEMPDANKEAEYPLINPDQDKEVRPKINVVKATLVCNTTGIGTARYERFSRWRSLVKAIACLKRLIRTKFGGTATRSAVEDLEQAELFIIKSVQYEVYRDELHCLGKGRPLSPSSSLLTLNPFLDETGVLRVGGRVKKSAIGLLEKTPAIIPGKHHVSVLLVRYYHEKIKHQGRHFTEGALRSAGLWITGAKRITSSIIHKCVNCRKLRGRTETQIMSDLPADRLEQSPPFTNVGVDVFGPWAVTSRRTRGGCATSKRWGILFSCLVTRAVHIELVEEMSADAFINALKRFISVRGPVKIIRSDRGTNFIGAASELQLDVINVEDQPTKQFLLNSGTQWIFNTPHSSHMGGAWERMIRTCRRILDSIFMEHSQIRLTHDILNTFMAEVSAIVNSRPLVPVSTDSECPLILTPAMLLTQKTEYKFLTGACEGGSSRNMYKSSWKRVQALSTVFWSRWRKEYLPLLQERRKWSETRRDLQVGDVVLLKDKNLTKYEWPIGRIENVFKGNDGHVRKAEIKVMINGKATRYIRPIVNMVLLVETNRL